MASSSSSSSRNWVYDVFVSFRGEDVRKNFLSHLMKELDRKLIKTFIDNEIKKGESINFVLKQAIRTSRIAVVVFSENYGSSSWCLDELVEIVKCKEELDQVVVPIFYGLDPCHVRHQFGKFGEVFAKTCERKSENEKKLWRQSLTEVANLCGNHPQNWPNDANMVEEIANDVLSKKLDLIPQKEFENLVGMEDHIAKMSKLLHLESEEVRMVGIWGTSGIGKTSIARVLFSQLSPRFQCSIFIDKGFISNVMKMYKSANPDDLNVKLHLVGSFLSKLLDKKDIKIGSYDAMEEMLKHHKVLIFIDDLDRQMVLDALVGQIQWFGCGSRIIVITQDKRFLRCHGIDHIYEVCLPSNKVALKMFCKSAFGKFSPPDGLMKFASEIALSAGNLPLGLHVLGSYVRGIEKEELIEMLPDLRNRLNGDIEKTLRVSYDGLNSPKDKAIFRHIACLFNGESVSDIKLLLAHGNLDVNIGLKNLVDKSLIHINYYGIIEMHTLLQKMGKEIVRAMPNDPQEQEFLVEAKEICALLESNNGTSKVLGIALDINEMDELHIHESAFKKMPNLHFLKVYTEDLYEKKLATKWDEEWHLPQKLRWLRFDGYPGRCMPSSFCPENLVKLEMRGSKLEKLWEGVQTLKGLKRLDLSESIYLKEIPDLSKATNLEKLFLHKCSSLVDLPYSIKYLNKLYVLLMPECSSLETLPNGINLQSLYTLDLHNCPRLKSFPDISTNVSQLFLTQEGVNEYHSNLSGGNIGMNRITSETLWARVQPNSLTRLDLSDIPSLVELPSLIQNFIKLEILSICYCINLETLPTGIKFCFLKELTFTGCSRLKTFPNLSTSIEYLSLGGTAVEEVPCWIQNFTYLQCITLENCKNLVRVSLNIFKLKYLMAAEFSNCGALTNASWYGSPITIDEALTHRKLQVRFVNLDPEDILQNRSIISNSMVLSGEEVPSYFTYQTTGYSMTNIPLRLTSLSRRLFRFRACMVVGSENFSLTFSMAICVTCQFKDRFGNRLGQNTQNHSFSERTMDQMLFVCDSLIPLAQLNYDHVDMEIQIRSMGPNDYIEYKLKRWGILVLEECSSPMNQLSNPYKVSGSEDSEDNEECILDFFSCRFLGL